MHTLCNFSFKKKNLLKKSLLHSNTTGFSDVLCTLSNCYSHYTRNMILDSIISTIWRGKISIFCFQVHFLAVHAAMGVQQLSPLLKVQHWTLQTKDAWCRRDWKEAGCTGCNYSLVLTDGNRGSPKKSHLQAFTFKVQIIFAVSSIRSAALFSKSIQGNPFTPVTHMPNLYHFLVLLNTEES